MFKQIGAVTSMNVRGIPQRLGASLVIVIGIAVTVGVMVSVLAMAVGFNKTINSTGRIDRAIVLRGGSVSELGSTISRDNTLTIMDAAGVRHGEDGKPIASAEVLLIVGLPKKGEQSQANVTLRGVGPASFALRPEIHLTEGRMFQPAVHELIVGRSAQGQFAGLSVGSKIALRNSEWTVVGVFDSDGDSHESELLADVETVLSAFQRNLYQSVVVQLENPDAFNAFKDALTTNPTLSVDVKRETDYYKAQAQQLNKLLNFLAYFVGSIMAIGAVFGALNAMYSAVAARSLEIATLRAIGFGSFSVVVSVLIEALALALAGGAIGAIFAWLFFNGNTVSTLGGNFTQVVFHLTVSPTLLVTGIVWACVIGVIGGLFPAIRAARLPVAAALRAG
jgi:putative ABC transport system permease protein